MHECKTAIEEKVWIYSIDRLMMSNFEMPPPRLKWHNRFNVTIVTKMTALCDVSDIERRIHTHGRWTSTQSILINALHARTFSGAIIDAISCRPTRRSLSGIHFPLMTTSHYVSHPQSQHLQNNYTNRHLIYPYLASDGYDAMNEINILFIKGGEVRSSFMCCVNGFGFDIQTF